MTASMDVHIMRMVAYIAVSHVWNPAVSDAHNNGKTIAPLTKARDHVFGSLRQLGEALSQDSNDEDAELWYDYICVPQWQDELKEPILGIITDIFNGAKYTLVLFGDVDQEMVHKLYHGTTSDERIKAITGILNARWFSRVWTAMEYVRSPRTKVMTKNFQIVKGINDVFIKDTGKAWNEERKLWESVQALESYAGMGENIVPWNLGPLEYGRERKRLDFGNAFSLLARRGCRSGRDFFHALRGVVGRPDDFDGEFKAEDSKGVVERPDDLDGEFKAEDPDPVEAIVQIATACLNVGDYSPLLMAPRGITPESSALFSICGYNDVISFGLGKASGSPCYHDDSEFHLGASTLKLEKIGQVTYTLEGFREHYLISPFLSLARATLVFTGPDVKAFVNTVGPRMFNLSDASMESILC
ncbi:hypothetical protein M011DRAFT_462664 [Sporormia fimetaria CBS 119925]|uniref:Heterokaryon incompatibility domain-containing protein n=1 Tax=Sporormia fimetaria CBS 119925 TaxID=1340428 RepID=A0A6A6UYF7_9PLEO|nr:hypothetical protein M011DRAFT_462664 [Sporormia fimetaria CBS 119925]